MKFDVEWLTDQLDGAPGPDELADKLTACGFLVEVRDQVEGGEVWDVETTTNRPDSMNHRGLAREAATATGATLKPVDFELHESGDAIEDLATVAIEAPEACRRFCSRVVRGVNDRPSPPWLQQRLERVGVRSISAVVDVTNYVLLTLGQPLHAYDLQQVGGAKLVARMARDGETLTTLDGEKRKLTPEMPVIADADGPVALAGVMGGLTSEIDDQTTDVWIEGANFDALKVRRTARALGMHTEASHRFERGADPELPPLAVDLAAAMIAELTGGTVCKGRIDVYPRPWTAHTLDFDLPALSAFAGLDIKAEQVLSILRSLELSPEIDGERVTCTIPSFRVDLECTADLYEEVIRHVGYDVIPARLPSTSTPPGHRHPNWELVDRGREAAIAAGLAEVMTFSFVEPEADALCATLPLCPGEPLHLENPLAQTQGTMRRSLLPGLLSAARDNLNCGERSLAIFEEGRVFAADADGAREAERLALVLAGGGIYRGVDSQVDFRQLKGVVTSVLERAAFPPLVWRRGGSPWLDDSEGAVLETVAGAAVGIAGVLSDELRGRWELKTRVYVAEIDLEGALEHLPVPVFQTLPRFPAVVTDMTVEHPQEVAYSDLETMVRELAGSLVENVELRARYTGKGLPPGAVRTTLRLVYRHPERSLTQDEVNAEHEGLRERLAERLGVRFA